MSRSRGGEGGEGGGKGGEVGGEVWEVREGEVVGKEGGEV